jgi:DNA-binding CsgD family transcriptional regulator
LSWTTLPPELRGLAERELTSRQLQALILWNAGNGYDRVGLQLGISKESAVGLIRRGVDRLRKAAEAADISFGEIGP